MINKINFISAAFIEFVSVKFAYSVGIEDQPYIHFAVMEEFKLNG